MLFLVHKGSGGCQIVKSSISDKISAPMSAKIPSLLVCPNHRPVTAFPEARKESLRKEPP